MRAVATPDASGAASLVLKTCRTHLCACLAVAAVANSACSLAHAGPTGVAKAADALELLVLGSGGPGATGRAASSYLVLVKGVPQILVDAGPGSFARMGEAHVSLEFLDTVLLTHLHVDHAAELPGIIKARAVSAGGPIQFDVYGPAGRAAQGEAAAFPSTERFMALLFGAQGAFAYLKDFAAPVTFKVVNLPRPGSGEQPALIRSRNDLAISAITGHHGDAPAIIYRIDYRGQSIVFSGDIDPSGLPALAENCGRGESAGVRRGRARPAGFPRSALRPALAAPGNRSACREQPRQDAAAHSPVTRG